MALFTQDPNPTNDPNWLNQSQGTSRAEPDLSAASAVKGLTNMGEIAVAGLDASFRSTIRNKLYEIKDRVTGGEFGVTEASGTAGAGASPTQVAGDSTYSLLSGQEPVITGTGGQGRGAPPGVTRLGNTIKRLTQAYNSGQMSESYYWGKINSEVSKVTQQFPGYRDVIDEMTKSVFGADPANTLRKQLLSDLDASARMSQSKSDKDVNYLRQHGQYLPPDAIEKYRSGEVPIGVYEPHILKQQATEQNIDLAKKSLELKDKAGTLSVKDSERSFQETLDTVVNNEANSMMSTSSGDTTLAKLQKKVDEMAANPGSYSKKDQENLTIALGQYEAGLRSKLVSISMQPGGDGKSFAQRINDPAKVRAQIDFAMERVTNMKTALVDQSFGLWGVDARRIKAEEDASTRAMLTHPEWGDYNKNRKTIRTMHGQDAINEVLQQPGVLAVDKRVLSDAIFLNTAAASGQNRLPGSVGEAIDAARKQTQMEPGEAADFSADIVKRHVNLITNPKSTPAQIRDASVALFQPKNLDFLNKWRSDAQPRVFGLMASPAVTAKIEALGDPVIRDGYSAWARHSWNSLMRSTAKDVQDAIQTQGLIVQFDEKNSRFDVRFDPNNPPARFVGANGVIDRAAMRQEETLNLARQTGIENMNIGIEVMKPIIKMKGGDVNKELWRTIQDLGIETNAPKTSYLGSLFRAIGQGISDATVPKDMFDRPITREQFDQRFNAGMPDLSKAEKRGGVWYVPDPANPAASFRVRKGSPLEGRLEDTEKASKESTTNGP